MDSKTIVTRGAVFVLVFALTVTVVSAGPMMEQPTEESTVSHESVDVQSFQPDTILSEMSNDSGTISLSEDATDETVLIDLGHQNDVTEEELGPLVRTLSKNGASVEFHTREQTRGDAFNESLRGADAFITVSPQRAYTSSQVDGLRAFADGGGRILMAQEPMEMSMGYYFLPGASQTTSPAPMAPLASEFGLSFGNGYLYNMYENDNNYRSVYATPPPSSNLSGELDRVTVREGTPVYGGQTILAVSDRTTLSTTREKAAYPLAARSGNVMAVGDTSFLTETGYQDTDNEELAAHLIDFLVAGEKAPGVPKEPTPPERSGPSNGSEQPPRPAP